MPAPCRATSWPVGHTDRMRRRRLKEAALLSFRATRRCAARSRGISPRGSQAAFIGRCGVARCERAPQAIAARSLGSFRPAPRRSACLPAGRDDKVLLATTERCRNDGSGLERASVPMTTSATVQRRMSGVRGSSTNGASPRPSGRTARSASPSSSCAPTTPTARASNGPSPPPASSATPVDVYAAYQLRPTVEEDRRQEKCFWDTTGLRCPSFPQVVNWILFVELASSLVRAFVRQIERGELAGTTRQRLLDSLLPQENQVALYPR